MQVVQPLFFFLAEQLDLAGQQAEEEPALRIAYDDVNEHCCSPSSVYGLITVLKQQCSTTSTAGPRTAAHEQRRPVQLQQGGPQDLWAALLQAGVQVCAAQLC